MDPSITPSPAAQPTLWWEDFVPGSTREFGGRLVTREDILRFAREFDPQPFHVDEAAAQESIFGGLAASGWFTAGLWMRAYADGVLSRATSLGSPGGEEIAWPAPVFAGDELTATMEVVEARLSRSRPGVGLVKLRAHLRRGDQDVYRSTFTGMFGTRERPA